VGKNLWIAVSIFIVGCSVETTDIIRRGLELRGPARNVKTFKSGVEAIDALCDRDRLWPELIVVDACMPDAERFVEFIKLSPFVRRIPMIAIEGRVETVVLKYGEALGLLGVLKHPFTPEQFVGMVSLRQTETQ
jgi:CheY-like chemotaxis protein